MTQEIEDGFFDGEIEETLYEHFRLQVDKGQSLVRIDKFLHERLGQSTRTRIQYAIEVGSVKVNDKTVKNNYRVKPLDIITIVLPKPPRNEEILPENIPLDIVYEDEHMLLVYKAAGMVVHPAFGNWTGTLVNALVYHFGQLPTSRNGAIRPGLIHRIDKDTSGLMVIAKSELAMSHLAKQFFYHTIERTYHALVWGVPKQPKGTIKNYLNRAQHDRKLTAVYDDPEKGKIAITHYTVLETFGNTHALIECKLETGRTHQIRAHMKHLGHPLVSDAMYGGDKVCRGNYTGSYKHMVDRLMEALPRQALHAKTLGFTHPSSHEYVFFDSTYPHDFQAGLEILRKYYV